LVGETIPLMGRILAIADAYDAMTSRRPYREGMPHERAFEILAERAGIQWDPVMVNKFLAIPFHEILTEAAIDGMGEDRNWHTDDGWLRHGASTFFNNGMFGRASFEIMDDALTTICSANFAQV
ncbi:MAG: hypothetical protein FJ267_03140, partial [Planctomycetes bacterium]|nr:hypothetical protein [Planctomycetota bacterium]